MSKEPIIKPPQKLQDFEFVESSTKRNSTENFKFFVLFRFFAFFSIMLVVISTRWGFLSLMKANVIVHFENHTFFYLPTREVLSPVNQKTCYEFKKHTMWCGFSKFTHVRTISKTIFFLASHLENDRYTSWWVFKNLQRNCFFGGAPGVPFFFFFKYILWWNIF